MSNKQIGLSSIPKHNDAVSFSRESPNKIMLMCKGLSHSFSFRRAKCNNSNKNTSVSNLKKNKNIELQQHFTGSYKKNYMREY